MLQGVERDRAVIPNTETMIPRLLLLNIMRTLNVLNNPILSDVVVVYSYLLYTYTHTKIHSEIFSFFLPCF